MAKLLFIGTQDWLFARHHLPLVRAARERDHDVVVAAADHGQGARIAAAGARFVPLTPGLWRNHPVAVARCVGTLRRIMLEQAPALVQLHGIRAALAGLAAARLAAIPRRIAAVNGLGMVSASTGLPGDGMRALARMLTGAAMAGGTGLSIFEKRHPDRYYDVGIAEEHAALFACGLATQGYKPFLTIYSTFMQRAYDMLIHDIALQNLNVALCMDRAGLSGDDGPTHHGLFDIGYLRHVPNFVFMQPKDEEEFADMLWTMANYRKGPIAIRYPRGAGTGAKPKEHPQILEIGQSEVLRHGRRVLLLGLGNMVEMAEETADLLAAQGIDAAVINARWIKPLDTQTLEFFARGAEVVCTFEDHVLHNGYGAAVIEALSDARITTPVVRIGWPDEFVEHGSVPVLREKHGLTAADAVKKILAELKEEPAVAKSSPAA